jgi:hypothetical protein
VGKGIIVDESEQSACEACCQARDACKYKMTIEIPKGYEKYGEMFKFCLEHTAKGKGMERHGNGEPFHKQFICVETAEEGHGFARGQAKKKITEAKRLKPAAAIREIAGAVNYLIADMIVMKQGETNVNTGYDGYYGRATGGSMKSPTCAECKHYQQGRVLAYPKKDPENKRVWVHCVCGFTVNDRSMTCNSFVQGDK